MSGHVNVSDILGQDPVAGSPPGFAPIITLDTTTCGGQWTHLFGSAAVNQFRIGYTRSSSITQTANPDLDFAAAGRYPGHIARPARAGRAAHDDYRLQPHRRHRQHAERRDGRLPLHR